MTQVVAVELDQVKRVEEHTTIIVPVADALEVRDPVIAARDGLPVQDAGVRAQPCQCVDNERKAPCQVIARTAVELYTRAALAGNGKPSCLIPCSQSAPE